jgi:N-acetylglucosaminyl-diphospho-decaprenol L-rhamnosyltransferase
VSVVAIIVNYRTPQATLDCVAALLPELAPFGGRAIVIDNASGDDSHEVLPEEFANRGWDDGRVEFIASSKNGGFGYGNNLGGSAALRKDPSADYFLFINPDAVIAPGSVRAMIDYLVTHPSVGIVGGRIRDRHGTERKNVFRFPSLLSELESSLRLGVASKLLSPWTISRAAEGPATECDWVSGAGFMIRVSAWVELGGFDEGFFLYFEEIDLCHRAQNLGWHAAIIEGASIEHAQGLATGFGNPTKPMPAYWFESRRRYWRKHHGSMQLALANVVWASAYCSFRVRSALQGRTVTDPPGLLGDFIRHNLRP